MRFLFYRFNSVCEPDMIEGFEQLGHSVDTIDLEMTVKEPEIEQVISCFEKAFEKSGYDAVVSVNYYPMVSEICRIYGIRYISWTVDSPVLELLSDTVANDVNRIFCFDQSQCEELRAYNPAGVFYMPLATNCDRWDRVIAGASPEEHRKFSSDISFVGSLYTEKCPYDDLTDPPEYLRGYLEGLMRAQKDVYGAFFLDSALNAKVIEDFVAHTPGFYTPPEKARNDRRFIMAMKYLGMKVTNLERLEVMELLGKKHSVDVYTGSDTSALPVNNKGFAKTLTEMPLIFHNSKVNLNITCKSIKTGIAQRIWDIMGAGGFLLTNYQSEIPRFFTPGEDLDIYASMEELADKAAFYLTHDEVRKKIAENAREKIRAEHTHKDRVSDMIYLAFS